MNQFKELLIEKYIKPSETEIKGGIITIERWFNKHGELHNVNGQPSGILYYSNGYVSSKHWYKNGKKHRDKSPAVVFYKDNGKLDCIVYKKNDIYIKSIEY